MAALLPKSTRFIGGNWQVFLTLLLLQCHCEAMEDTWTIGELAARAAEALAADQPRQSSGRVREMPNDRLIRWYSTVGLVDPPLSRTGRIARYGRRHLLQLVAVKRRQSEGRSLSDIQAELLGAPDAYLESVARLPVPAAASAAAALAAPSAQSAHDEKFWLRRPARMTAEARNGPRQAANAPVPGPAPDLVHGVRLAHGVLLVLDPDHIAADRLDAAELREAAGPLLQALAAAGLDYGSPDQEGDRSEC
jgi:DNA-binding transcriptional MerR regulator